MTQIVVPAVSEPALKNQPAAARLAVIIDLLAGLGGSVGIGLNFHYISAASANQDAANDVAVPCILNGYNMVNTASYFTYVKFYNVANPTSASTPIRVVGLPASGGIAQSDLRQPFSAVMSTRITKGQADNDATAVVAGDVLMSVDYQNA